MNTTTILVETHSDHQALAPHCHSQYAARVGFLDSQEGDQHQDPHICINNNIKMNGDNKMELGHGIQGSKLLVARGGVRIGIVPPLELVTCSHVFSPQLPLNQTCKLSSPNRLWPFDASAPPTPVNVGFRESLR